MLKRKYYLYLDETTYCNRLLYTQVGGFFRSLT